MGIAISGGALTNMANVIMQGKRGKQKTIKISGGSIVLIFIAALVIAIITIYVFTKL